MKHCVKRCSCGQCCPLDCNCHSCMSAACHRNCTCRDVRHCARYCPDGCRDCLKGKQCACKNCVKRKEKLKRQGKWVPCMKKREGCVLQCGCGECCPAECRCKKCAANQGV